jgi:hypothetical protein
VHWSIANRTTSNPIAEDPESEHDIGWVWMFDAVRDDKGFLHVSAWHSFDCDVDAAKASIAGRAQHEIFEAHSRQEQKTRRDERVADALQESMRRSLR